MSYTKMSPVSSILATLVLILELVQGQEQTPATNSSQCYGGGAIATAVLVTFFGTLVLAVLLFYWWKKKLRAKKETHLILESDPESGRKAEYAFDNPGFKDATLTATSEKHLKPDSTSKLKWAHWSPLSAFNLKSEKKRALDDSNITNHEVKVVALKSQDFTGLGFNICGNMKEGIYIKDILHRGPAFESGKLNPGDRVNSVTISFEHMVYEDALAILSYASPYEVIIEAKSGRIIPFAQGQGQNPIHPIFKSSSLTDLFQPEKSSKRKLFGDDYSSSSNYSSLQKSRSNVTTLERKESKSPRPLQPKYGIKVLPVEVQQKSPKIFEQNQNNVNIERNMEVIEIRSIDEVDETKLQPPQAKKREKKSPEPTTFDRAGSGIKRDENGIPLEIPEHLMDAAVVARKNRKSSAENGLINGVDAKKAKAPSPPSEVRLNFNLGGGKSKAFADLSTIGSRYGSDSEEEIDNNHSSVNTIELNSSDITIHQTEEEERKARKTASTGDLSKIQKPPRSNNGTLERAQSLDITDASGTSLIKQRTYDARENLLIDREPRLSLILDGLNTFQRDRLKKSTEWGNLEDAILNLNRDDEEWEQRRKSEPQFNAVMEKVVQIRRESEEIQDLPDDVVREYQRLDEPATTPKVNNCIWPDDVVVNVKKAVPAVPERTKIKNNEPQEAKVEKENGEIIPRPAERTLKDDAKIWASPKSHPLLNLTNSPSSTITVEYECIKPVPPKRERTPDREAVIDIQKGTPPVKCFEKNIIPKMCSEKAHARNPEGGMIKDEWETQDTLTNTSPPLSLTLVDEVMDSYNKNYGTNAVTIVRTNQDDSVNVPDETKTIGHVRNATANFLLNEKSVYESDTNIPDDVKVSRTSTSMESKISEMELKSDDAKSELLTSQVTVKENGGSNLHSLELSINNEPSELYTTALESTTGEIANDVTVIVSQPDNITVQEINASPIVEITENSFSKVAKSPEVVGQANQIKIGEEGHKVEITESQFSTFEVDITNSKEPLVEDIGVVEIKPIDAESPAVSLTEIQQLDDEYPAHGADKKTYITEIQVSTPNNLVSEVKVSPQTTSDELDTAFEQYVKNFEQKLNTFESNMQNFENNLDEFIREEPKSIILEEKNDDVEEQISKIQEKVQEQLKTLPEMRFTTSSYEADRKTPEKRHSFELLRSNFEKQANDKSPPRRGSTTPPKSRIPISTTMKTPPMSPERRDSRNLENENESAILELMSSSTIHSTPFTSKIKPPSVSSKNVSVTSIRSNSKIPSGLPTLSSRPPIPPRRSDSDGVLPSNGDSSFKQWVFSPNSNVTNVAVGKEK